MTKLTDIMKPGDMFIYQTRLGNWELAEADEVRENGDITVKYDSKTYKLYPTLKQVLAVAESRGLTRTWKIGYHRWKVEKTA